MMMMRRMMSIVIIIIIIFHRGLGRLSCSGIDVLLPLSLIFITNPAENIPGWSKLLSQSSMDKYSDGGCTQAL
jgi:hypothetical protein